MHQVSHFTPSSLAAPWTVAQKFSRDIVGQQKSTSTPSNLHLLNIILSLLSLKKKLQMTSFSWLSTWIILFLWYHDVHFQRRTSPDATWNSTHCRETCSSFLLSKKRQKGIRTRMYSTTLREDRDGVHREAAAAIPSPVSSPLFKGNTRPAYNNLLSPRSPFVFVSWLGLCYICPPPPPWSMLSPPLLPRLTRN